MVGNSIRPIKQAAKAIPQAPGDSTNNFAYVANAAFATLGTDTLGNSKNSITANSTTAAFAWIEQTTHINFVCFIEAFARITKMAGDATQHIIKTLKRPLADIDTAASAITF